MQENRVWVIIPVYGDLKVWQYRAYIAAESIRKQTIQPDSMLIVKGHNITHCRNVALTTDSEFIIFLDADDELHPNYIEEMLKGTSDIRVPAVHRYYEDGSIDTDQKWYTPKDLMTGNYIVVGAMVRTELFKKLGGFHDYESLEDWDLWLRAEEAGATFEQVPNATYKVHKRAGSRNSNKSFHQILDNAKQRRGIQ